MKFPTLPMTACDQCLDSVMAAAPELPPILFIYCPHNQALSRCEDGRWSSHCPLSPEEGERVIERHCALKRAIVDRTLGELPTSTDRPS